MALRQMNSLAYDDEDIYDRTKGMPEGYEPPEFPPGCCFAVSKEDLAKIGADGGEPGHTMRFSAMGEVTSIFKEMDDCRIELELTELAGEDGKFQDLTNPAHICLSRSELDKIGLDSDCERGDTIHLIGTARMQSSSSTEYGDMASLQIIEMAFEDESSESRGG